MKITSKDKESLKNEAIKALNNPYPKSSETVFAAAVLTKDGNIYSSAQYVSTTYSLTLHAEQSALAHAAAHGEGDIAAIAVTSSENKNSLTYPCHMCKQLLWENHLESKLPIQLICFNKSGKVEEYDIEETINLPWPSKEK
ncbi:cytidine deaminase [Patescibacteria group bacterium]